MDLTGPGDRAAAFLLLVAGLTLAAWLPIIATGHAAYTLPSFALLGFGAFAPLIAALSLAWIAHRRAAAVTIARCVVAWRRLTRAAVVPALATLLLVPMAALATAALLPGWAAGPPPESLIAAVALAVLMGPLNEEAGCVGWLQPALDRCLAGWVALVAAAVAVHACWNAGIAALPLGPVAYTVRAVLALALGVAVAVAGHSSRRRASHGRETAGPARSTG